MFHGFKWIRFSILEKGYVSIQTHLPKYELSSIFLDSSKQRNSIQCSQITFVPRVKEMGYNIKPLCVEIILRGHYAKPFERSHNLEKKMNK